MGNLPFATVAWREQEPLSPQDGCHVLASVDAAGIVVYQAFRPEIAAYAVAHQLFGGEFSVGRMSWIKPGFLWMMHRSGWATKPGQERVFAVRLSHAIFDRLVAQAVPSAFDPEVGIR